MHQVAEADVAALLRIAAEAAVRLPGGVRLRMTLFREPNGAPFTDRDARLVRAFNEHVARAYFADAAQVVPHPKAPAPWSAAAALPPRLRPVLERLLAGDSEKEAARHLGLSRHTVHQYAHVLFRVFGVNSRGALMARFIAGPADPS